MTDESTSTGASAAKHSATDLALPAYADFVDTDGVFDETVVAPRSRWPFVVLIVLGGLLFALPVGTGMFTRAAGGQEMLTAFAPFMSQDPRDSRNSEDTLARFRGYLHTVDTARTAVQAHRAQAGGQYQHLDAFVGQWPSIRNDLDNLLNTVAGQAGNYQRLRGIGAFDVLPFLLAVPGLVLVGAGVSGLRRVRAGTTATAPRVLAALAALTLVAVPFTDGLFARAPAGAELIDAFAPVMTHQRVASVQQHFVVLVSAEGELDAQFLVDLRTRDPHASVPGIDAFIAQWQPMTADFASLIGVMADNMDNFSRVVALDRLTAALGFRTFDYIGWFYLIPGALALALALDPKGIATWATHR